MDHPPTHLFTKGEDPRKDECRPIPRTGINTGTSNPTVARNTIHAEPVEVWCFLPRRDTSSQSPLIRASFFLRLHTFICRSQAKASSLVANSSEYTSLAEAVLRCTLHIVRHNALRASSQGHPYDPYNMNYLRSAEYIPRNRFVSPWPSVLTLRPFD